MDKLPLVLWMLLYPLACSMELRLEWPTMDEEEKLEWKERKVQRGGITLVIWVLGMILLFPYS